MFTANINYGRTIPSKNVHLATARQVVGNGGQASTAYTLENQARVYSVQLRAATKFIYSNYEMGSGSKPENERTHRRTSSRAVLRIEASSSDYVPDQTFHDHRANKSVVSNIKFVARRILRLFNCIVGKLQTDLFTYPRCVLT